MGNRGRLTPSIEGKRGMGRRHRTSGAKSSASTEMGHCAIRSTRGGCVLAFGRAKPIRNIPDVILLIMGNKLREHADSFGDSKWFKAPP